jgi:hypothetical protein
LGARQFVDPNMVDPNWRGFDQPGSTIPWAAKDAFAQLRTTGVLGYPRLPVSRYVFEVELTLSKHCGMEFQLGDQWNATQIFLYENPKAHLVECTLMDWFHGRWGWGPKRDFAPGERIALKLVLGAAGKRCSTRTTASWGATLGQLTAV